MPSAMAEVDSMWIRALATKDDWCSQRDHSNLQRKANLRQK